MRPGHAGATGTRVKTAGKVGTGKTRSVETDREWRGRYGWWNGQNWVTEVLKRAVEHDLPAINPEERNNEINTTAEP